MFTKTCYLRLIYYVVTVVFFSCFYISTLRSNKNENCTVQSIDLLKVERKYSKYVNIHLRNFFKNSISSTFTLTQKWTLLVSNIYGYSAFFEKCPLNIPSKFCVKIIAILSSNFSSVVPFTSSIKCAIRNNSFIYKEKFATIETIPESHNKLFTASFIFCPVRVDFYPTYASVYDNSSNLTWLHIENSQIIKDLRLNSSEAMHLISIASHRINLCVRPFYDDFDFLKFNEFLIYYSVMGIDHFIFYYIDSFKPLQTFLSFVKFSNFSCEIHLWDIPLDNDFVHEYGQIAFTQDCLARSKRRFTHTLIVDLDEYIVPKIHKNIRSLVSYLDDQNKLAGSYVIPMTLFCYEYSSESTHIFPFDILNHKKRQRSTWLHHYRSKYISIPDRVRYGGVHFTWKFEDNYKEIFVSPNIALLNHYRFCCGVAQTWLLHLLEFKVLNDVVVTDTSLAEHKDELLNHYLFKLFMNFLSGDFV